jgi:hypothetical protein
VAQKGVGRRSGDLECRSAKRRRSKGVTRKARVVP